MNQKKYFLCICMLCFSILSVFADGSSGKMSYQAVVRDASGKLMVNAPIGVSISIHLNSTNGDMVFSEVHQVNSNENGLISLIVGGGSTSTTLDQIDWSSGDYYLKSRVDPNGGTNYTIESTTQLMSVPYALHSRSAERLTQAISFDDLVNVPVLFSGDYNDLTNAPLVNVKDTVDKYNFSGDYDDLTNKPSGNSEGDILYWSNTYDSPGWEILPIGTEGQVLTVASGKLAWIDPSFANTSATTYQVGDIYYGTDGNAEGVVFELSTVGRYAKIVALHDLAAVAWDTLATDTIFSEGYTGLRPITTGANSSNSGEENMQAIKRITDWQTKHPDFGAVAANGDGWFLPSSDELSAIYTLKSSINHELTRSEERRVGKEC